MALCDALARLIHFRLWLGDLEGVRSGGGFGLRGGLGVGVLVVVLAVGARGHLATRPAMGSIKNEAVDL